MRSGYRFLAASLLLPLLMAPGLQATADAERGLEIARTMNERDEGFGNYTATMEMILIDTGGKETVRRLQAKVLEVPGDGEKNIAVFEQPADVKGTVFLSHTHIDRPDDQWLYLPALKRVKRISPANKTAPFMGSEFSYEDLASAELEKFRYEYLGEANIGGQSVFLLQRTPVYDHSGYSRQVVSVDQERYVALRTEYYDRDGRKMKTLLASDYTQYLDRYWRAGKMRMENHESGKSTLLVWRDYQFRQDLDDQDFQPSALLRMR